MTPPVPAPWGLTGSGLILVYRFPREFVLDGGFVPPQYRDAYVGGFGTVMLVDYQTSDAGPYQELLFIPGQFRFAGKRYYAITKIYVSTQISVDNGRTNWAIPKELAAFDLSDDSRAQVKLGQSEPFFSLNIQSGGLGLPFNTAWSPIKPTLGQHQQDSFYITSPGGSGKIQRARVSDVRVNPALFPDIAPFKPLLALRARDFRLTFPVAQVLPFSQVSGVHPHAN